MTCQRVAQTVRHIKTRDRHRVSVVQIDGVE